MLSTLILPRPGRPSICGHDLTSHQAKFHAQPAPVPSTARPPHRPPPCGVSLCPPVQPAPDRAGGKPGNNGRGATLAGIEMVPLLKAIDAKA